MNPDFPMPTWDSLRDAMPPWPTLHHAFRTSSRNFDGELADFRETHIYETVDAVQASAAFCAVREAKSLYFWQAGPACPSCGSRTSPPWKMNTAS